MITEDYVSFATAKLLKEKGFEGRMHTFYTEEGTEIESAYVVPSNFFPIYRPTLQMAMKWLEEKYGIFCVIRRHCNKDDGFTYSWNCEGKSGLSVGNGGGFKTTEEAREACIKYCLENLI